MADAEVQLQPDSTGKSIDNTTETTGAGAVYRQRISVAAAGSNNQLAIDASGNLTVNPAGGAFAVTNAGLTNLDVALSTRLKPADTLTKVATVDTITNAVAVTSSGLTNLDVALSTRTKPADQQHAIVDSGTLTAVTSVTNPVAVTNAGLTNLDVALSTRTKPADQQHAIIDSGTVTSITNPVAVNLSGTGTNTNPILVEATILTAPLDVQQNGGLPWGVTQSTTPWVVDGSAVTQPVSGAVTAAAETKVRDGAGALAGVGVIANGVFQAMPITDQMARRMEMSTNELLVEMLARLDESTDILRGIAAIDGPYLLRQNRGAL